MEEWYEILENITKGDNLHHFKLIIFLIISHLFIATTSASIPIDSCTAIVYPGEYELTQNVTSYDSECIRIYSNDVIFNGAGYTINNDSATAAMAPFRVLPSYGQSFGVSVEDLGNVTVKNLKLTNFDFGIYYNYSSNGFIINNNVSSIGVSGIIVMNSNDIILSNNNASNTEFGINILYSDNIIISNNRASKNNYSIIIQESSNNNLAENVVSNNQWGIALYGSNSNILADNIALNNYCGIRLRNSSNNNLIRNIANSNNFSGIYLTNSQNNFFEDNTVSDNYQWDFYSNASSINNDVINLNMGPTLSFTSKDVMIKDSPPPASDPPGYRTINKYIYSTGSSPDSWLFMNVSYSNIDVENVNENTLRMWKYHDIWSQVSGTNGVNTELNYVFAEITNFSVFAPMADMPPASVTNLLNISYAQDFINWTWTDPDDEDFDKVMVYLDLVWVDNVSKGVQYYNATNLTPATTYSISIRTVDSAGNINQTLINHTSKTALPPPDTEPPASVTNLINVSYAPDFINWTWTDPTDSDFKGVMVYLDGVFQINVSKSYNHYNHYQATELAPEKAYTISTQTYDNTGKINQTFVNNTSTTAPIKPIIITIISPLNNSINTTGNVNVTAIFDRPGSALLNWNGFNESMNGSGISFYKNKPRLLSGKFLFKIYAIDSNRTSVSETRILTVNRTEKELLSIDSETGKTNQTFEKVAPSGNVTLKIYNSTYVSGCSVGSNLIFMNSWAQLNQTLINNLKSTDKLLGENFSVEPDCYRFNPDAQIQFNYTDEQLKARGITSESDIRIKVYNTATNEWVVVRTGKQDTNLNNIIVNISHFSFYCLVGETPARRPGKINNGGGGGGGGGGGASGEAFENILISETVRENVFKGSKVCYKFNKEDNIIRYINFTGLKNSGEIISKVEILKNTSTLVKNDLPPDIVYLNLNIWLGNLGWASSENIANPKINFEVNKSWVLENGINVSTIRLFRNSDGRWKPLITTKIREEDYNLIFEAEASEFSPFAVCGKNLATEGGAGIVIDTKISPDKPEDSPIMTDTTGKSIPGFKLSAGLTLLMILVQILRKKKLYD